MACDGFASKSTGRQMTASAARANSKSSRMAHDEAWTQREQWARRVADRQELTLLRSAIQCGSNENARFDLMYQRYHQAVAYGLKLSEVEDWLGIRSWAQR